MSKICRLLSKFLITTSPHVSRAHNYKKIVWVWVPHGPTKILWFAMWTWPTRCLLTPQKRQDASLDGLIRKFGWAMWNSHVLSFLCGETPVNVPKKGETGMVWTHPGPHLATTRLLTCCYNPYFCYFNLPFGCLNPISVAKICYDQLRS